MFGKIKKFIEAKRILDNWDYLFKQNPEIENIGSRKEYMEYVKSIFPNSKSKQVLFHGGRKGIDKFMSPKDPNLKKNKGIGTATKDYGIYFTADKGMAKQYTRGHKRKDRQIYCVLVNAENPVFTDVWFALQIRKAINEDVFWPARITDKDYKKLSDAGHDSIIWGGERGEVVVFDPKQIHILGTQEDLDKFRQWKTNKTMTQTIAQSLGNKRG